MKNEPKYLIVHHEAPPVITDSPRFGIVDSYHKTKGFPKSSLGYYCGYHYFIEKTGQIWKARQDNEIGAHTIGYNDKSIGICLAGDFDLEKPSIVQESALQSLLKEKMAYYGILPENIVPHRRFAAKSCYGSNLTDNWARNLVEDKRIKILQALVEAYKKLISLLLKKQI